MTQESDIRPGLKEMDAEHEVQMALMNALEQGLAEGRGKSDVSSMLHQLVEYTNMHFMSEQLLMRLHAYPNFGEHELEHERLIEQLRKIEASFAAGDTAMTTAELLMLKRLVIDHINSHDQAFSVYLDEAAKASPADRGQLH